MPAPNPELVFLKLGGSLITDKRRPEAARGDVIARLAAEIAAACRRRPELRLVLGHGSGSFGHQVARRYETRLGVSTREQWLGFARTAESAYRLTRLVTAALIAEGLPVWSLQPSVSLRCRDGQILEGPFPVIRDALAAGLVPLVHGDVALDSVRGGTIASTEEIFIWLCQYLTPGRIILAGEVNGVYSADPLRHEDAIPIAAITPSNLAGLGLGLGGSHGVDVTGGMAAKVDQCLHLVRDYAGLTVTLCSGLEPGNLQRALTDPEQPVGTLIADPNQEANRLSGRGLRKP